VIVRHDKRKTSLSISKGFVIPEILRDQGSKVVSSYYGDHPFTADRIVWGEFHTSDPWRWFLI
jgi:hypothetical protein